jgi:hypothetical protein
LRIDLFSQSVSTALLSQLLVTEAIREFERWFEGTNDKWTHAEKHICQLGRKPGFAMTSQLLQSGQETISSFDDIIKFLTCRLSASRRRAARSIRIGAC